MIIHPLGYQAGLVLALPTPTEHLPCARTGAVRSLHTWDDLRVGGVRYAVDVEVAHLWDPADGVGVRFWRLIGGPPTTRADVPGGYVWANAVPGYDAAALHRLIVERVAALPWPEAEQEGEE